jgi:adenosylcobyric acid synthase
MSLNSAATPDGREIGRAQALQAEACRVAPRAEMNPILIKPSSDRSAQVVVMGRVWGQVTAADYHQRRVEELFPVVVGAYHTLAAEHDVIVLEGAGSPAEINLKAHDIVNMRMAQAVSAACLLVVDIDRGGVFASLLGTLELLDPAERALVRGFVVNKFRGDIALLEPGISMMESRVGVRCAGVVPYLPDLGLDDEDSVSMEDRRTQWEIEPVSPSRRLRIAVARFPFLSNFTDFDPLEAEPSVSLAFVDTPEALRAADLVILPGSKQTLDDLAWLRQRGLEPAIRQFRGAGVLGICGGMQMLGRSIEDPTGAESGGSPRVEPGLSLLSIRTVLHAEKVTRMARGRVSAALFGGTMAGSGFHGYEIHLGRTVYDEGTQPFAEIQRCGDAAPVPDGAAGLNAAGTYIHGLFRDDGFRHSFIAAARNACGLDPARELVEVEAERERRLDRLANHVRSSLDMRLIFESLGVGAR